MVNKTPLETQVPTCKTRDEEEFKALTFNSSEEKVTVAPNNQFICNIVRRQILPPQRYNYVDLICYMLNVVEELQNLKQKILKNAFENQKNNNHWRQ